MPAADVLFVTMDGGGNVPPLLAVASVVAAAGHHVRVAGHACLADDVTRAGLPFEPYRHARPWDSAREQSPLKWVPMFNDRNIADEVDRLCAERRPDVAVVDCMLLPPLQRLQRNTFAPSCSPTPSADTSTVCTAGVPAPRHCCTGTASASCGKRPT